MPSRLAYRLERHFWKSCTRSRAVIIVAISFISSTDFNLLIEQTALNWTSLITIAITLSSPNKSFPTYNISYYSFFTIHFRSKNKSKVLHSQPLSAITIIWACLFTLATASPFFTERKGNYFQRFTKGTHRLLTPCNAQWRLFHSISSQQILIIDAGPQPADPSTGGLDRRWLHGGFDPTQVHRDQMRCWKES